MTLAAGDTGSEVGRRGGPVSVWAWRGGSRLAGSCSRKIRYVIAAVGLMSCHVVHVVHVVPVYSILETPQRTVAVAREFHHDDASGWQP